MRPAIDRLRTALGTTDLRGYRAPGRANLIGEHTDYNGGFVLPVALEMDTCVAGRHTAERVLRLRSLDEPGDIVVDLDSRAPAHPEDGWGRYAAGVVRSALDEGHALRGFDGVIASDVPIGAGLSSSAALEVSIAKAVLAADPGPLAIARMCRRAENVYVGARTGIMDQLAAAACEGGSALFIDCRDETFEPVALPDNVAVLVIDSDVRRRLVASGYNERRADCERATAALGVTSLRDARLADVEAADMDDDARRRARHVVTENGRVLGTVAALRAGDLDEIGRLFAASHRSMNEDFGITTPEVDALVDIASGIPGVVAARMTGGGFGGCTVNLVRSGAQQQAAEAVVAAYGRGTGLRARFWISRPAAGAGPLYEKSR